MVKLKLWKYAFGSEKEQIISLGHYMYHVLSTY